MDSSLLVDVEHDGILPAVYGPENPEHPRLAWTNPAQVRLEPRRARGGRPPCRKATTQAARPRRVARRPFWRRRLWTARSAMSPNMNRARSRTSGRLPLASKGPSRSVARAVCPAGCRPGPAATGSPRGLASAAPRAPARTWRARDHRQATDGRVQAATRVYAESGSRSTARVSTSRARGRSCARVVGGARLLERATSARPSAVCTQGSSGASVAARSRSGIASSYCPARRSINPRTHAARATSGLFLEHVAQGRACLIGAVEAGKEIAEVRGGQRRRG